MKRENSIFIVQLLLLLLFLYASSSKLFTINEFYNEMAGQPFPKWLASILTYAIPISQIGTGLLLVFEKTKFYGFIAATLLLTAFTLYIAAVLLKFFSYIPCSCAGVLKSLEWRSHLVFNIFFLLIAGIGTLLLIREKKHNRFKIFRANQVQTS